MYECKLSYFTNRTAQHVPCQYDFNSAFGNITSPNRPHNYNDSLKCIWTIKRAIGEKVYIFFNEFNLQDLDRVRVIFINYSTVQYIIYKNIKECAYYALTYYFVQLHCSFFIVSITKTQTNR